MDKSGVFQEAKFYEQIREELRYKPELLAKDAAFCWWFIHFQTGDNVKSSNAITGRGGDKNIDALWIDEKEKIVNVLQGKLRTKFGKSSEKRNDLTGLLDLTDVFYNDEARKNLTKKLPAKIIQKIDDGVNRVKRGYKIRLWYITTGKVSETYKEEFVEKATLKTGNPELRVYDYKNIKSCYLDWKDNIFPAVVDYTLPIDSANFSGGGYINRSDNKYNLDTWICTVLSTELKKMYEELGDAIFSRNVRGYLGDKGINAELTQTVKNEPEKFWYYNNGITMICRDCEHKVKHSKPVLEISRPQIVNGLQTTKSLANEASPDASVLLKVINIGEGTTNTNFVHKIVQATNKQNPVSNEDLASNDDVQIELWRNFDRVDCLYIRKRGETVTQIENRYGYKADLTFSKYDLAKAVAACTMDPQIPRKGPNLIFDQSRTGKYYKQIFNSKDIDFYLACMSVEKLTQHVLRRIIKKKHKTLYSSHSKWLVMYFIWDRLQREIKTGEGSRRFRKVYIDYPEPAYKIFSKIVILSYKITRYFYRDCNKMPNISKDGIAVDESVFYNKPNLWKNFMSYSKKHRRSDLVELDKQFKKLIKELKKIQLK